VEELARVVPVVHGLRGVDALVALEADQLTTRPPAEDLGDLRLADAGLSLEQQRPPQRQREEDRRREPLVGQVPVPAEGVGDLRGGRRDLGGRMRVRPCIEGVRRFDHCRPG
jgi:hypothetical protein